MNFINNSTNVTLRYILYLFPFFIILGNAVINSATILVLFIYFLKCFFEKKILFFEIFEFKFFLFFYLYLLINSFFSDDIKTSLIRTIPYLKFFIFVLIYKNFIEEKKIVLKNLGFFWLFIVIFLSLDIIYQSILGYNILSFSTADKARNSGLFMDELVAGGFLLSLVFIIYFLIIEKKNYFYFYLFLIFFLIVIFLTGERSNFLKFIFVLTCVFLFYSKSRLIFKILSLSSLILLIVFFISNIGSFKDRYLSSITFSSNQNLNLIDTYFTSQYGSHTISSFYILKDNLFFGVGNKNFRNVCKNYSYEVIEFQKKIDKNEGEGRLYASGCATHSHQNYNEFLSEHGIVGTMILLFIFYMLILKNFSFKKKSSLNLVCFFYILTYFIPILPSGSFFSTLPSTLFWINYLFYIVNNGKDD